MLWLDHHLEILPRVSKFKYSECTNESKWNMKVNWRELARVKHFREVTKNICIAICICVFGGKDRKVGGGRKRERERIFIHWISLYFCLISDPSLTFRPRLFLLHWKAITMTCYHLLCIWTLFKKTLYTPDEFFLFADLRVLRNLVLCSVFCLRYIIKPFKRAQNLHPLKER